MKPYYEQDGIVIYHGDCSEVMPLLPAATFDIVVTSPPYNLGNTTGGGFPTLGHYNTEDGYKARGGGGKWRRASQEGGIGNGYDNHADDMPHEKYVEWQHHIIQDCWRLIGNAGAIFYNHKCRVLGGQCVTPLEYVPEDLPIRQVIIWARAGGINFSPAFYLPTHEWIVLIAKPDFRLKSKGASGIGDVWQITQEMNNSHPAPFPMALPKNCIETTDAKMILDPFSGSGTTLVAAKQMGRKAVGIEKNERYIDMAIKRLQQKVLQFTD